MGCRKISGLTFPPPPAARRLWVAYSGGLDSTVLLHCLSQLEVPGLNAVHIHHGLQPLADRWLQDCRQRCREWGVPFKALKVRVPVRHAAGPEAAAREARYEALGGLLQKGDVLVTAHHLDDQAETVLLRLLRGSGIPGLAAMSGLTGFGPGRLWRPLLEIPRAKLLDYAQEHGLRWIEDPHNRQPRYARSYLRQEIWPLLERHWPQATQSLGRTARLAAEASQLLDEVAAHDHADAGDGEALSVVALQRMTAPRRHNLLRWWLRRCRFEMPAASALDRLDAEVLSAKADAQPLLRCGDYEFRRYRDHLHVMALLAPAPRTRLHWPQGRLTLPDGCGTLSRSGYRGALEVRFAQGGESLRQRSGAPARSLKNLFQERGVPPWVRTRVPLVYKSDELLAVADLFAGEGAQRLGLKLKWSGDRPPGCPGND